MVWKVKEASKVKTEYSWFSYATEVTGQPSILGIYAERTYKKTSIDETDFYNVTVLMIDKTVIMS